MIEELKKLCNERGIRLIDNDPTLPIRQGILYSQRLNLIVASKDVSDINISVCIDYLRRMPTKDSEAVQPS